LDLGGGVRVVSNNSYLMRTCIDVALAYNDIVDNAVYPALALSAALVAATRPRARSLSFDRVHNISFGELQMAIMILF